MTRARGSAVVEAALAVGLVAAVTSAILLAAYAAFGRGYVEYQSEQALYCLSEGKPAATCARNFRSAVERTLPRGRLRDLGLAGDRDRWRIHFVWTLLAFEFRVNKSLSLRRILGRAVSR